MNVFAVKSKAKNGRSVDRVGLAVVSGYRKPSMTSALPHGTYVLKVRHFVEQAQRVLLR